MNEQSESPMCRCCGDKAARKINLGDGLTDYKVYRDMDGPLCYACYQELQHGSLGPAVRQVQRENQYHAKRSRKR